MRDLYQPKDYSIGVIAYCQTQSDIYYLLIRHTKWHRAFPKGHPESWETMKQTALRELHEETWVNQIILWDQIYTEHYQFISHGGIIIKQVDYFLGQCDECRPTTIQPEETIKAWWYNYDESIKLLTFEQSKDLLRQIHITI